MTRARWNFLRGDSDSISRTEEACLYTEDSQEIIDATDGAIRDLVCFVRPLWVSENQLDRIVDIFVASVKDVLEALP